MSSEHIFWVVISAIVGVVIFLVVPIIGYFWQVIARDSKLIELKLELVRQGFTAADVERVVKANAEPLPTTRPNMTTEELKLELGQQGYSAEDIVQIVQATPAQTQRVPTAAA